MDWQVNTEPLTALVLVEMDWMSTRQEGQGRKKTSTRRQAVGRVSTRGLDRASTRTRRSTRVRVSTSRGKGSTKRVGLPDQG